MGILGRTGLENDVQQSPRNISEKYFQINNESEILANLMASMPRHLNAIIRALGGYINEKKKKKNIIIFY